MEGGLYRPIAQLLRRNMRNDAINAAARENGVFRNIEASRRPIFAGRRRFRGFCHNISCSRREGGGRCGQGAADAAFTVSLRARPMGKAPLLD
jgi:hypothetical protein